MVLAIHPLAALGAPWVLMPAICQLVAWAAIHGILPLALDELVVPWVMMPVTHQLVAWAVVRHGSQPLVLDGLVVIRGNRHLELPGQAAMTLAVHPLAPHGQVGVESCPFFLKSVLALTVAAVSMMEASMKAAALHR